MYKIVRDTEVTIFYRGKEEKAFVGIANRPWHKDKNETETLFGLCLNWPHTPDADYLSHMSYSLRDYPADGFVRDARSDKFYFDAGTTRAEIYITKDELKRALIALDLISNDMD